VLDALVHEAYAFFKQGNLAVSEENLKAAVERCSLEFPQPKALQRRMKRSERMLLAFLQAAGVVDADAGMPIAANA